MAEEKQKPDEKKTMKEKTQEKKNTQPDVKPSPVTNSAEGASEEKSTEKKSSEKAKEDKVEIPKKDVAVARGRSYPISTKQSQYLCAFVKNKTIDQALADLAAVQILKKAVPFKGEIPHRKGPMMSGRYPVKAAGYFVNLVKALRGNILVNQMDVEKSKITTAAATQARRPSRRRGRQHGKRTHVTLESKESKPKTQKDKGAKK